MKNSKVWHVFDTSKPEAKSEIGRILSPDVSQALTLARKFWPKAGPIKVKRVVLAQSWPHPGQESEGKRKIMEKVKTLKFRCKKVEIEEKTISFLGDANKREAHIHAHFESPDLKPRDGDRSNLSVTLSKDAKERLAEFGYEVGKVYELVAT